MRLSDSDNSAPRSTLLKTRPPPTTPAPRVRQRTTTAVSTASRWDREGGLLGMTGTRFTRRGPSLADDEDVQVKSGGVREVLKSKHLFQLRVMACDEQRRRMDMYLSVLAVMSIAVVGTQVLVVWHHGSGAVKTPTGVLIPEVSTEPDWLFWFAAGCKGLLVLLNIMSVCCVASYYQARLDAKRLEWSQDILKSATNVESYKFLSSSLFPKFLIEVFIHLIFPYPWLTTSHPTLYHFLQIAMLCRMYFVFRFLHTNSAAFGKRVKIRQWYQEHYQMNLKVDWHLSVKMQFYKHSVKMTAACCLVAMLLAAFALHVLERKSPDPDSPEFGDFYNCIWFSFVTFTTIGYGDMSPKTHMGRFVTVMLGVVSQGLLAVFGGVVTNKLAPSRQQQLVTNYLADRKGKDARRSAAASVVQAFWIASRYGSFENTPSPSASQSQSKPPQQEQGNSPKEGPLRKVGAVRIAPVVEFARSATRRATNLPVSILRDLHEHKRNKLYKALKQFRNKKSDLNEAQLQSADLVLDHKLDQIGDTIEGILDSIHELGGVVAALAERQDLDARRGVDAFASSYNSPSRKGSTVGMRTGQPRLGGAKRRSSSPRRNSGWSPGGSVRGSAMPPIVQELICQLSPVSSPVHGGADPAAKRAAAGSPEGAAPAGADSPRRLADPPLRRRGVSFREPVGVASAPTSSVGGSSGAMRRPRRPSLRTLSPPGTPLCPSVSSRKQADSATSKRPKSASVFNNSYMRVVSATTGLTDEDRTYTEESDLTDSTGQRAAVQPPSAAADGPSGMSAPAESDDPAEVSAMDDILAASARQTIVDAASLPDGSASSRGDLDSFFGRQNSAALRERLSGSLSAPAALTSVDLPPAPAPEPSSAGWPWGGQQAAQPPAADLPAQRHAHPLLQPAAAAEGAALLLAPEYPTPPRRSSAPSPPQPSPGRSARATQSVPAHPPPLAADVPPPLPAPPRLSRHREPQPRRGDASRGSQRALRPADPQPPAPGSSSWPTRSALLSSATTPVGHPPAAAAPAGGWPHRTQPQGGAALLGGAAGAPPQPPPAAPGGPGSGTQRAHSPRHRPPEPPAAPLLRLA
eukprot:TRINITY_DN28662_c0_g1_i1.p1 TRINITY_DN28662_c0_g1~~TRINITY_DN28662_c0_g1_i1.p1  ORF type:complete len:1085 (+),score=221.62 TRINITY_DN28662_c0_g1_i1:94-3348(+)